jgi:hypothetical protein
MRRGRYPAGLVLAAFGGALTVLPWMHTLHHRDDHVHVDGAIVFLDRGRGHGQEHDHAGDEDEDEDEDGSPGFDHPAHGRGALAHGAAFILAGAIFLFPPPGIALEGLPLPPPPATPALTPQRGTRLTRGPPPAGFVVLTSLQLVAFSVG